uniref:Uncharacterized protein n=1 Tax=Meloidogyne enterolobii TaxID=390850 RepID=A0A6V7U589_MELEN|nr:unnamed protein product [Meloidogyne enterolobii]
MEFYSFLLFLIGFGCILNVTNSMMHPAPPQEIQMVGDPAGTQTSQSSNNSKGCMECPHCNICECCQFCKLVSLCKKYLGSYKLFGFCCKGKN